MSKDNGGSASDKFQQARRELFEAWAPYRTDLNKDGFYASSHTRAQWSAFNAALDCVVIELPDSNCEAQDNYMLACERAIESTNLGIKVK